MRVSRAAIGVAVILMVAVIQVLSAQSDSGIHESMAPLLPGLSEEELSTLIETGELTESTRGETSARMAPAFGSTVLSQLTDLAPRVGVEVLFLVPSPLDAGVLTLVAYETLQSMNTMEGIEYFSASRGHMRTLFYQSFVIDNPDDRNRLADPVPSFIPREETLYVFQEDSSFGKNVLELQFETTSDAVLLSMQNLTRMLYAGFIPAVAPRGLQLHLVIRPVGDHLLFYGNFGADALTLFGVERRVQTSFYNRLVALYQWYVRELQVATDQ